jgi:hypothetical protein
MESDITSTEKQVFKLLRSLAPRDEREKRLVAKVLVFLYKNLTGVGYVSTGPQVHWVLGEYRMVGVIVKVSCFGVEV